VLIETTPVVAELSAKIYGTPQEALESYADWSDEEAAAVYRFQKMSQEWLEERLARVERLIAEKRGA
jgi:hypothetical protein